MLFPHVPKIGFTAAVGGQTDGSMIVAVLAFLFPAIYEDGWRPIAKMLMIWIMVLVLVILIRVPLPTEIPWLLELLGLQ